MIHLTLLIGQLTGAIAGCLVDHRRRHDLGITGFACFSEEEIDECTLQTSSLTDIYGETCTGDFYTEVEVDKVVFLSQIPMRQFGIFGFGILFFRPISERNGSSLC